VRIGIRNTTMINIELNIGDISDIPEPITPNEKKSPEKSAKPARISIPPPPMKNQGFAGVTPAQEFFSSSVVYSSVVSSALGSTIVIVMSAVLLS
jgi:hypothetical protein